MLRAPNSALMVRKESGSSGHASFRQEVWSGGLLCKVKFNPCLLSSPKFGSLAQQKTAGGFSGDLACGDGKVCLNCNVSMFMGLLLKRTAK